MIPRVGHLLHDPARIEPEVKVMGEEPSQRPSRAGRLSLPAFAWNTFAPAHSALPKVPTASCTFA